MNFLFTPQISNNLTIKSQMIVQGIDSTSGNVARVGSIANTLNGSHVEIVDYSKNKPKTLAAFTAPNLDVALGMIHGHKHMRGFELENVF